jgi:hypothetical protein
MTLLSTLVAFIVLVRAGQLEESGGMGPDCLNTATFWVGVLHAPAIALMAWTDGFIHQLIHFPGTLVFFLFFYVLLFTIYFSISRSFYLFFS